MEEKYIISIDQSTQGTKALLFDGSGTLVKRADKSHRQIVNEKGWVSHDPMEIYQNVISVAGALTEGIDRLAWASATRGKHPLLGKKILGNPLGMQSCGNVHVRRKFVSVWKNPAWAKASARKQG